MPIDWSALPGVPLPAGSGATPDHLGDLGGELEAVSDPARDTVALTDLAWIRCTGEDARNFLHNQLTSDVNHLEPGHWQHSAWCSAKGRMLASLVLACPAGAPGDAPEFLLGLPAELLPAILRRLRMFVLRAKVRLDDLGESIATLGLQGPDASRLVAGLAGPGNSTGQPVIRLDGGWALRTGEAAWLVAVASARLTSLGELTMRARPVGLAAWRLAEVRRGVPVVRLETQEEFVPQMVNFDKIGGVSFHKGCYPGQEVIARTQYLGKVKRHLYRVRSSQPLAAGLALYSDVREGESSAACGVVADAARAPDGAWEGLAVILETAAAEPIHAGGANGPVLFNIDLVAA